MSEQRPKVMLGELLIEKRVISQDQLSIALTEQQKQNIPLGKVLVKLGFVSEAMMRDMLGEALGQESVDLTKVVVDSEAIKVVSMEFAKRYHLMPIAFDADGKQITIAMANTFDVVAMDKLRGLLGDEITIKPLLAGEVEIDNAIDQFFGFELSVEGILKEMETGEIDPQVAISADAEYSQPLVRLVDSLISDAVKRGASDIHFEPEESFYRIRYRIDGVLRQIRSLHQKYCSMVTVRIKVMAGLNIAETRSPQDGHFSLQLFGRPVDFRVSCLATTHGENVVLRILDRKKGVLSLDNMELPPESLQTFKLMMGRPEGIILVTGPTGSGKTTTLYAMLEWLNSESVNIMTLEDPVEYPLAQVRQTSVNPAANLTFAEGIRTMLRQDPDIILVGEIRDEETANMAFRAAMTGHQVLSTVHANSAVKAITRLKDIGVQEQILAGNIIGVIGQRLVRKLCTYCRETRAPVPAERRLLSIPDEQEAMIPEKKGCTYCDYQGYKGRMSIIETVRMDDDLDAMVAAGATHQELQAATRKKGYRTMADDGARLVLEGLTTLDEVARVVDLTDRIP
ncbi:MAG: Flp pilus assembly complex ATPase component TadA [Magnetococcales bacterium]|nr:Flp pilus assembly complex ATPase component TadA [Magnetococcales bacterium]